MNVTSARFEIGDRVQLHDGGPVMRVTDLRHPIVQRDMSMAEQMAALRDAPVRDTTRVEVRCSWHDAYHRPKTEWYPQEALIPACNLEDDDPLDVEFDL